MTVKKITKMVLIVSFVFALGGIGGVFFDKYLVPILSGSNFFAKHHLFQDIEKNTTIINKTETKIVREDNLIGEISSGAVSSTVGVLSFSDVKAQQISQVKTVGLLKKTKKQKTIGKRGSGVILTNDGVVVTYKNDILIKDAHYKVVVFDGSVYQATLLGVDEYTNLAFLRINGINLPAISFANSDDVNPGKKVVLMGYSLGKNHIALTEGILTEFDPTFNLSGQTVASSEKMDGVFKVDFGGSEQYVGGPVIDFNGEMLALTGSLKINNKEIYFQIPVNRIKEALNRVANGSFKKQATLGVSYLPVDIYNQELYHLSVNKGALIFSPSGENGLAIIDGSPADKANLRVGDVVLAVNNKKIDLEHSLSFYVNHFQKGDKATFQILRDGKKVNVSVEF